MASTCEVPSTRSLSLSPSAIGAPPGVGLVSVSRADCFRGRVHFHTLFLDSYWSTGYSWNSIGRWSRERERKAWRATCRRLDASSTLGTAVREVRVAHEIPIGKEEDGWNAFESQKERFGRVRPRNFEHVAHVCTVLVLQEGGAISARGPSVRLVFVRFSIRPRRTRRGRTEDGARVLRLCRCDAAARVATRLGSLRVDPTGSDGQPRVDPSHLPPSYGRLGFPSPSIARPSVGDPFSPAPSAAGWVRLIHSWGAFGSGSPPNRTSSLRPTNRSGLFRSTVSRSSGPFVRETETKPTWTWRTAAAVARRGSWRTSQRPSSTCTTSEARAWRPSWRAEGWCRAQHRARAERARRRSHVPAEPRSPWRKKPPRTRPRRPQHLRTTRDSRTRGSRSSWTSSTSSSKLVTKSQETYCASTTVAPTWTSAPSPPHSCRRTKSALARSRGCVSKHGRKRSKPSRSHAMRRKTHVEGWRSTRDGAGVGRWTEKLT